MVPTHCDNAGVRRDVVVLGSTGSIGTQALDIVRANPERFRVVALTAGGGNPDRFRAQVEEFSPTFHGLGEEASVDAAARECDVVLNGITGAVGLRPTLAALDAGNVLALANKESLIIGGPLVTDRASPEQIVPVDSEHSALAQCLRAGSAGEVRRLVLTASGGPFRGRSREQLAEVTVEEALAHPTWDMGPVVTINSATLVNKGLEVIEAHLLFGVPFDRIEVVVHPTSVVHSMVEFVDGSTVVQADRHQDGDEEQHHPEGVVERGHGFPSIRRPSIRRLASWRAQSSAASTSSTVSSSSEGTSWSASTEATVGTMSTNRNRPSRKAATHSSLAAL